MVFATAKAVLQALCFKIRACRALSLISAPVSQARHKEPSRRHPPIARRSRRHVDREDCIALHRCLASTGRHAKLAWYYFHKTSVCLVRVLRICLLGGIFIALVLSAFDAARASAWLAPPGKGQIITTAVFSDSTRYFDASGKLIPIPAYTKFSLGSYIEYGLSDEFTLVARPFFDADRQATIPAPTRLAGGGAEIGVRAGIANFGDTVVSVQALAHVPFVSHRPLVTFESDSIVSGDFRLLIGHGFSLSGLDSFIDLQGGYRRVGDARPDEWHVDATFGARLRQNTLLLLQSFATIAAQATQAAPAYAWVKLQESLVYDLSACWSLQGGVFETVAGMNAGRELGPMAALWYRF
jgi:protein XagA